MYAYFIDNIISNRKSDAIDRWFFMENSLSGYLIYWNEKKIHLLATNRIAFKPTYPVLSRVVDICLYKSLLR